MRFSHMFGSLLAGSLAAASLIQPRDTCAIVDLDLNVLGIVLGKVDVCLCLGGIDTFITADLNALLVLLAGKANVEAALRAAILSGKPCNSSPSGRKRSPADIARTEHRCEFGLTKCSIWTGARSPSRSWPPSTAPSMDYALVHAYECLDTMTNLESCGGCMEPYTLGLTSEEIAWLKPGVDCTADPGVSDVECRVGRCVVRKCKRGYELVPREGEEDKGLFECVRKGEMHKQVGGNLQWKKSD